jgi:hypothetical protein
MNGEEIRKTVKQNQRAAVYDKERKLTPLQKEFVNQYLKLNFDVCAAGRATYLKNPKSAHRWAWDTFRLPNVETEIKKRVQEALHDAGFNKETLVMEWLKMAKSDISNFLTWEMQHDEATNTYTPTVRVKDSSEMDTSSIKSVKVSRTGKLEFEMYDKQTALKQLGELMGAYPKASNTVELTGKDGGAIQIESVRAKLLERLNKVVGESQQDEPAGTESVPEQLK